MSPFILLENTKSHPAGERTLYFVDPTEEIICTDPTLLDACLDKIDYMRQQGFYLVGFVSYEASYFLAPYPVSDYVHQDDFPLLHFYVFRDRQDSISSLSSPRRRGSIYRTIQHCMSRLFSEWVPAFAGMTKNKKPVSDVKLNITEKEYADQFEKIKKHIIDGDTYQVNFTVKYDFTMQGDPLELYQLLRERQKVEYAALFYFKDYQILSLSPELFFSKQANKITTKPMKGTMPRSTDSAVDSQNKKVLTTDPKLIAENIMIVDLLRNDVSKVAIPGSLSVSGLLHVESYETVHQMVSTIECEVAIDTSFKTLIESLFPCGSITGVPKKRTMQIIHDLEKNPRRLYTGAIGYVTPDNDMCFSVAIRTLLIRDKKGELGVGGGIISDSVMDQELEELKLKARFFTGLV